MRAETDAAFARTVKEGGFGKFVHNRELTPIDKQLIVRSNRDTLYSMGVFDLDAGPVTLSLPPADRRFMSMQVIDEDEYTPTVYYGAGAYTLTKDRVDEQPHREAELRRVGRHSIRRMRRQHSKLPADGEVHHLTSSNTRHSIAGGTCSEPRRCRRPSLLL